MPVSLLAVVGEACLSPPLLGPADPATPPGAAAAKAGITPWEKMKNEVGFPCNPNPFLMK